MFKLVDDEIVKWLETHDRKPLGLSFYQELDVGMDLSWSKFVICFYLIEPDVWLVTLKVVLI